MLFAELFKDPALGDWPGLGLAVQAYQKRAIAVIDWLQAIAEEANRRIPVRLVKGAYWDREIKLAQQHGLRGYPVFTRKSSTDLSYLVCAQRLLKADDAFYPQFATHNAQTAAAIITIADECKAVREAVGIMDISAFTKVEVAGPGAEALLDRLVANKLPQKPGTFDADTLAGCGRQRP